MTRLANRTPRVTAAVPRAALAGPHAALGIRVASLGMYDAPWLQGENDRLWRALRAAMGTVETPDLLDRTRPLAEVLRDPTLLLGQTCGLPLMTTLRGVVRLVATPVYDLPGCDGPNHCSFIVVRLDDPVRQLADLRGRSAAINGRDSNSGMNLLRAAIAPLSRDGRFFGQVMVTGSHLSSLAAVREAQADVAAIDCVTYGLTRLHRPDLVRGLRILDRTPSTPVLPLVTANGTPDALVARLRQALDACLPWPALALASVQVLDLAAYEVVLQLERQASERGFPILS